MSESKRSKMTSDDQAGAPLDMDESAALTAVETFHVSGYDDGIADGDIHVGALWGTAHTHAPPSPSC